MTSMAVKRLSGLNILSSFHIRRLSGEVLRAPLSPPSPDRFTRIGGADGRAGSLQTPGADAINGFFYNFGCWREILSRI
jgi:hypothetical protein